MPSVTIQFRGGLNSVEPCTVSAMTLLQAIDIATSQIAFFRPDPRSGRKLLRVKDHSTYESLAAPLMEDVIISVWPAYCGGKTGGFIKIALGIVLVAAAFAVPQTLLLGTLGYGGLAKVLLGIGASMLLGGVLDFLSAAPTTDLTSAAADPEPSKYLAANQNTVKIGTRIPLAYGRVRAYGHIISFNVNATDVAT